MSETTPLPFLIRAAREPFADARVKEAPEDFIVEEIPLYEPCGEGTHTYLYIEKRRLNSMDAAARLARALGKKRRGVV